QTKQQSQGQYSQWRHGVSLHMNRGLGSMKCSVAPLFPVVHYESSASSGCLKEISESPRGYIEANAKLAYQRECDTQAFYIFINARPGGFSPLPLSLPEPSCARPAFPVWHPKWEFGHVDLGTTTVSS